MTISLLILAGLVAVLMGRFLFGTWFNHVALYSVIWTGSLSLFELRLIRYYPLQPETWAIIIAAWACFLLGSATAVLGRSSRKLTGPVVRPGAIPAARMELEQRILHRTLWILIGITSLVALQHWSIVLKEFKSLTNVLIYGNIVYSSRVQEGLPGSIPYLDALGLVASLIAGIYTASIGRLRIVAVLPILIVMVEAFAAMGRSKILLAALLFVSGFFLSRARLRDTRPIGVPIRKFRLWIGFVILAVLLVLGAELVRSTRVTVEQFAGASKALQKLEGGSFITPSIYLYMTVHHGVLNQYLKRDTENIPIGSYSLAPFWRVLSKVGFETYVPQYQPYYTTPAPANTGTYLRELHADYGLAGITFGPYLLGLIASFLWIRMMEKGFLLHLVILGHIYALLGVTFLLLATMWGYWVFSLLSGGFIAWWLDRSLRRSTRSGSQLPGHPVNVG